MKENAPSTLAIILAGGEGARLLEKEYPKCLMRLVIEPVIEILINKLLANDPHADIFVVIRKKWQRDFERWLAAYRERLDSEKVIDSPLIELVIEESISASPPHSCEGTLPAIYRTLNHLHSSYEFTQGQPFFVFNADNYFDDDLGDFLKTSREWLVDSACFCVNAAYTISDYREAKCYGVIHIRGNQIRNLDEKPKNPTFKDTLISTGCYAFRYDEETKKHFRDFLKERCEDSSPVDVAFVIMNGIKEGKVARYLELKGAWFDIGTRRNLTLALAHYVSENVDPIRTIGDLKGQPHGSVADRCFVFARSCNLKVSDDTLTFQFTNKDPIDTKKKVADEPGEWIKALAELVSSPKGTCSDLIQKLGRIESDERLFLSGGILLIDTEEVTAKIQASKSRIPLQRRDFGARLDPDRLTMPAGALDTLSLTECCYAEMQEELICFGIPHLESSKRVLYYLHNPNLSNRLRLLSKYEFLEHVLKKQLQIPGMDPADLRYARSDHNAMSAIIKTVTVNEYDLSAYRREAHVFKVVLENEDQVMDKGWFFVSLDQHSQTLECRKIAWANLSNVQDNTEEVQPNDFYGTLAGIADGEGHGRLPVVFGIDSLLEYVNHLDTKTHAELVDQIRSGPDKLLQILCAGEAGTGRFNRFRFDAPIVTMTPSVGAISSFLQLICSS